MPLSIEIWYTVIHTSLMGVNESLHFLSMYFCLFWNTCGIGDVHKNLLSNGQLCESWHSVSHTFFNETNVFLFVLSTFIFQFSQILVLYIYIYTHTHTHTHTHIMLLSIGRFCENRCWKGITFFIYVTHIKLCVSHESLCNCESKDSTGKACVPQYGVHH